MAEERGVHRIIGWEGKHARPNGVRKLDLATVAPHDQPPPQRSWGTPLAGRLPVQAGVLTAEPPAHGGHFARVHDVNVRQGPAASSG